MYFETQLLGWPNTWMEGHVAWSSQPIGLADQHQDSPEIRPQAGLDTPAQGAALVGRV
jgi:hypothetical protein